MKAGVEVDGRGWLLVLVVACHENFHYLFHALSAITFWFTSISIEDEGRISPNPIEIGHKILSGINNS